MSNYPFETFPLTKRIGIVNPVANLDARYGPWPTFNDALTGFSNLIREVGLTVAVSSVNGIKEYWYKDGVANTDLVLKTAVDPSLTTIVQTNSANWNTAYTWVTANSGNVGSNVKILNNTEFSLDASSFGTFFKIVTSDSTFTYSNFNNGQVITLYLSAAHQTTARHRLPSPTYLGSVDSSNEIYTYDGYVTKTTIQRIANEYYGISNIIKTNIGQNIGVLGRILLDQNNDNLLQENSSHIIL